MDKLKIYGGRPLQGVIKIGGAKNSALKILIASLLTEKECYFKNVPNLLDIKTTLTLLEHLGVQINSQLDKNEVQLNSRHVKCLDAPYDLVRTMRASVLVLGPLLARFGEAKVSLPGGCAIGARPINYHLSGLEKLGAKIEMAEGYVIASAKKLHGNRVVFEFPSVTATENIMMAATLAHGESILENCAREPEVVDLARMLKRMGAEIEGEGTAMIRIQGKPSLNGCEYEIMGDRIEAATFLTAAFATQGNITCEGLQPEYLEAVLMKFEEAGAKILRGDHSIRLESYNRPTALDFTTLPYPGFPTDMQAQFMALMCIANGSSIVTETIYENRFMHVPELNRLGADITIRGNSVLIKGKDVLKGAPVMSTDLRASASLVIGGLIAEGETTVEHIYHLDRGYEQMEKKLTILGAQIERFSIPNIEN